MDELLVEHLGEAQILVLEQGIGIVYGLDTSEELVVEHQRIAVGREERGGFLLYLAELIGTIGCGERREQSRGTGEQSARLLEG